MAPMDPQKLAFLPEVREMCASNRCHMYGKCWTCPPGCGTLEEIREKALTYRQGILLQSTGCLEDEFDVETMQQTEQTHKQRFRTFSEQLRQWAPDCMPMLGALRNLLQLYLSRPALPVSEKGRPLHGGLWSAGLRGLSGRRSGVLLWTQNHDLFQLRPDRLNVFLVITSAIDGFCKP